MAGRQALINHTSKCTVTICDEGLEAQVWAARNVSHRVTLQVRSRAEAGMTMARSCLVSLGSCSVPPTPTLGASRPSAPSPPPSLMPFLEAGLIASEQAWPGSTAQGNLSTELRGPGRGLPDLYRPGHTTLLNRAPLPQLKLCSVQTTTPQVLGPNITSRGRLC